MKNEIIGAIIVSGILVAAYIKDKSNNQPQQNVSEDSAEVSAYVELPANPNSFCHEVNGHVFCTGLLTLPFNKLKAVNKKKPINWNVVRIVKARCSTPIAARNIAEQLKLAVAGSKSYSDVVTKLKVKFGKIFGIIPNYPNNLWYTLAYNLYHVPSVQQTKDMTYMLDLQQFAAGMLKPRNPTADYFSKTWLPR